MSIVLKMLRVNVPLHQWRSFDPSRFHSSALTKVDTRKLAGAILRQCSHSDVIDLLATEFNQLPEAIRIDFRTLAATQLASSGNVRKGLQRLNDRLNGKLLSQEHELVMNVRIESFDGARYKKIRVNKAVAGAKRKHGLL